MRFSVGDILCGIRREATTPVMELQTELVLPVAYYVLEMGCFRGSCIRSWIRPEGAMCVLCRQAQVLV